MDLTSTEKRLILSYRRAQTVYKDMALELLEMHPVEPARQDTGGGL